MIQLSPDLNHPPENVNHIHLMGICGTGMAALAGMLKDSGYNVTGSDNNVYPPMSIFLHDLGIQVSKGYGAHNLAPAPDLVIVGNVITRKNPEAIALSKAEIPYLSFPQALSHFFIRTRNSLVITGTHGKTTSCSLLATALYRASLDPTFMIGGIVKEFDANFRLGQGDYFIAEGDEYDTAFFDKESKFLHYQPQVAVLTSIEFDHADIFADLSVIKNAFRKFINLIPKDGLLIANFDDDNVLEVIENANCRIESYGLRSTYDWTIQDISTHNAASTFSVLKNGRHWAEMNLAMTGTHNCLNALSVCAVMNQLGVAPDVVRGGLETFQGVKRRQEVRGVAKNITVIDDFAHHPTAVKETLSALKKAYPDNRLVTVFEPRTNSSRRAIFQKDYVHSFDNAELVFLREPIPIDGLNEEELFSSSRLATELSGKKSIPAEAYPTTDEILDRLSQVLESGDIVAILSNGGFDNIHTRLLNQIREI